MAARKSSSKVFFCFFGVDDAFVFLAQGSPSEVTLISSAGSSSPFKSLLISSVSEFSEKLDSVLKIVFVYYIFH